MTDFSSVVRPRDACGRDLAVWWGRGEMDSRAVGVGTGCVSELLWGGGRVRAAMMV
jgi:hypothetical protein